MKIGIYTRISTTDQLDNFSLNFQKSRCEALAFAKGWQVSKIYIDEAKSGNNLNRPAFETMINDLNQSIIQGIVVFKWDRLSRNVNDTSQIIEIFSQNKWGLYSVTENIDLNSANGIMMIQFLSLFFQFERTTIKERMLEGFNEKRKLGGKIGGDEASVFGYTRNNHGEICINQDEAYVVRQIFKLHREGISQRKIVEILNIEKAKQRHGNKGWALTQVNRTLKKEFIYRGVETYRGGGGFKYPKLLAD